MRMWWSSLLVAGGLLLAACGSIAAEVEEGVALNVIPGQFIVTLARAELSALSTQDFELEVSRVGADHDTNRGRTLRLINAFVATDLDADDVVALRSDPRVAEVEPDRIMRVQATQLTPSWNLDRLDQRSLPLDRAFTYGGTGEGVTVYVVDTGIRSTHVEFGGRVRPGFTVIQDEHGTDDCHGHGTHVAGTVGGTTYGVAKGVALVPVRVMTCTGSGSTSGVIAGLDWIATSHSGPSVANLSLGGSVSSALDSAVRSLIARGVTVAVAAGNSNADACAYSPARVAEAITTGATTSSDARSAFSNFGTCVDLFAPGSGVRAATTSSDTASGNMSGTSMAAPHVAGVAALVLQAQPAATAAQVFTAVRDAATTGVLSGIGSGSPNRLLYVDPEAIVPVPNPAPGPEPEPDPDTNPEPAPPAGPPCIDCDLYTGNLSVTGAAQSWPNATGYVATAKSGLHQAWLRGPVGTNFDLVLERWNGRRWISVATSTGPTSLEDITYVGKAGTYRWIVVSSHGVGSYELYLSLP